MTNINKEKLSAPFWVVWIIEFWERFGYGGVFAILVAFLSDGLGFSEEKSTIIFTSYGAFSYGLLIIGGFVGDRLLGPRKTIIAGAIVLALSYAGLAFATASSIYFCLAGLIVGNALFKANPTSLISKMFDRDSQMINVAMTLYYFAINVGAILAMLMVPVLSKVYNSYSLGFMICSIGVIIGLANFLIFYTIVRKVPSPVDNKPSSKKYIPLVFIFAAIFTYILGLIISNNLVSSIIAYSVVVLGFIYFIFIAFAQGSKIARNKMLVALVLIIQAVVFFSLYFQMPTSIALFVKHNVDRTLFGFEIPYSSYVLLNPLFIALLTPLLMYLFKKFPSTHATKFTIGMFLCSLAFFTLYASKISAVAGFTSSWWLVLSYALQSASEICIAAIGLAMITQLSPISISGTATGVWFLASMLGGKIAGILGSMSADSNDSERTVLQSLDIYTHNFMIIGVVVFICAMLMLILVPKLNRVIKS